MTIDVEDSFLALKERQHYNEDVHCPMALRILSKADQGSIAAFCVAAKISLRTFHYWKRQNKLFAECVEFGLMAAKVNWEKEGRELMFNADPATAHVSLEVWRMIGWERFGISKSSRVRLQLDPNAKPNEHYAQLIDQATSGDFTAAEIKQLMEAINVGMNAHQAIEMQRQIDELKDDLRKMELNSDGKNSSANTGIA